MIVLWMFASSRSRVLRRSAVSMPIHDRLESTAARVLRRMEPHSSYFGLPIFALANADVVLSADVFGGHGTLFCCHRRRPGDRQAARDVGPQFPGGPPRSGFLVVESLVWGFFSFCRTNTKARVCQRMPGCRHSSLVTEIR